MNDLKSILGMEVPIIVRLGERQMSVSELADLAPGSIIELPKQVEEELQLLVSNKPVGQGIAVKVGENFGLQITFIGDLKARLAAATCFTVGEDSGQSGRNFGEGSAEQMLAGQL